MSNERDTLARVMARLLGARSLRPTDLIRKSGLSRQTVYSMIQGKGTPKRETLAKVASVIGADDLVPDDVENQKISRIYGYLVEALDPAVDAVELISRLTGDDQVQQGEKHSVFISHDRDESNARARLREALERPGVAYHFVDLAGGLEDLSEEQAEQALEAIALLDDVSADLQRKRSRANERRRR